MRTSPFLLVTLTGSFLLLSSTSSMAFGVYTEASSSVGGLPDVFGFCDSFDNANQLTCDTGEVVNTDKGTSWATAFSSLSLRSIKFVASAGEDGVSTSGAARINASLDDTYRLKSVRDEDTVIDVRILITGDVDTDNGPQAILGQSRVDFSGTLLDNQNFPGDQIIFDGAEFFSYDVVIPAFSLGEIAVLLDFTAQVNGDAVTDFSRTVSIEFFSDSALELVADSGVEVTTSIVPLPAAVWLFGSALCLVGWIRRVAS